MTKKKEEEHQGSLPWSFQDICSKIDGIAKKLAKEVIKYEPLDLLHRAFWINASKNIKGLSDGYSEHDRYISAQILEFIQNYLASLEPAHEKRYPLNDRAWKKIEKFVIDFNDYMIPFFILRSKDLQEHSGDYDIKSDELHTLDVMHWWGIRGNSFHVHHVTQLRELLLPQKEFFESVFNYRVEDFLRDLEKIQYSLTFGFGDAITETVDFYEKTVGFAKELSGSDKYPTDDELEIAIEETGTRQKSKDAFDRAFGLALCDD